MGQYERKNNPSVFFFFLHFNKLSNKKKEPMAKLKKKKTTVCFVAENVSILSFLYFFLPLVNDPGQASTL